MHLPPREGAVHGYERVERGTDEVGVPQMRIGAGDFVADSERGEMKYTPGTWASMPLARLAVMWAARMEAW